MITIVVGVSGSWKEREPAVPFALDITCGGREGDLERDGPSRRTEYEASELSVELPDFLVTRELFLVHIKSSAPFSESSEDDTEGEDGAELRDEWEKRARASMNFWELPNTSPIG